MNMPRNVDGNRLAKEIEMRVQPKGKRLFASLPGKEQLDEGETVLFYDGTDLKELTRYKSKLYEGAALTEL